MATYVLIPGADGRAWYWHLVAPQLHERGHDVVAVDLPVADPAAGFADYVAAVLSAIGDREGDVILVAQSLAGFIAPLVAERVPVTGVVLLNAMVPSPGETAGQWWKNTGQGRARAEYYAREHLQLPSEFDPFEAFFHDVPSAVVEEALAMGEPASRFDRLFGEPWPLHAWPDVPTRFLQAYDDRFLPLDFQRRIVAERLRIPVEVIPGGHLVALSRPKELAQRLDRS
jgi:pimeloyl-ACP methyl ester carboxylesterase